jgi:hypothetical protein
MLPARILLLMALVVGDSAANGRLHRRRFLRSLQAAHDLTAANDDKIKRQMQKDDDSTNPRANCPHDTYNVFQCDDPTQQWAIPCDSTSCVWDLTALSPDQPPELCRFITVNDVNAELPDEFKPCALWVIVFAKTSAPTIAPTLPPTLSTCPTETRHARVRETLFVLAIMDLTNHFSLQSQRRRRHLFRRCHQRRSQKGHQP